MCCAHRLLEKSQLPSALNVKFESKDFFMLGQSENEKFDLIYDYTYVEGSSFSDISSSQVYPRFFVAIPPTRRVEWGQIMSRLAKPGGYLIALVFPMDPPQDYGPPFFVRPKHYDEVLGEGWQKIIDRVPAVSLETHKNRERLVVWKRL